MSTRQAWMFALVLMILSCTIPNLSQGATYYISSSGSNTTDGLSSSSPWKTFSYAIPQLQPGDTLIVMDGVYSVSGGTGLPAITCGTNANNGTEGQPITIRAENERAALLESTGDYHHAFYMDGCSHWNIIGLRGKAADLPEADGGKPYSVFSISSSDHILLHRLLATHPNRYGNSQAISLGGCHYSLVEECEAYYFHRHGISIYRSDHITLRRSYVNSRGYADIPGGCPSHAGAEGLGDEGMTLYQTTDSIIENCISEGNEFFGNSGQRNKYMGNVALNNLYGYVVGHHCCDGYMEATDNTYINNVAAGSQYHGFLTQSDVNVFVDHLTSMNNVQYYGLYANNKYSDNNSSDPVVTWSVYPSLAVQNSLFLYNNIYGIRVNEDHVEDYAYRKFEYLNSYGHGQNYGPGLDPLKPEDFKEELSEVDPQMGSCIVFVPESSPMKKAGKNGEDIGANILYRYEEGILTGQALWDPDTGAFPCGAIVPALNDVPGSSCLDVHERLNVNANGCDLPEEVLTRVKVITFNGGEYLPTGEVRTITWGAPDTATKFNLSYTVDHGVTWKSIKKGVTGNHYAWTVPSFRANKEAKIKVVGLNSNNVKIGSDISDRQFTLGVVRILSPKGGETLYSGNDQAITWEIHRTVAEVAHINLFYTLNGGTTWKPIASLTGSAPDYIWTLPEAPVDKNKCKVKIVLKDATGRTIGTAASDAYFRVWNTGI